MRAVVLGCAALAACAPATRYHMPASLRGYAVYVPRHDSLSVRLAAAFRDRGLVVLHQVRGGSGPTVALIHFTLREGRGGPASLHVQLADTRTGVVIGVATLRLDSLPGKEPAVAAILDSLGLGSPRIPEP